MLPPHYSPAIMAGNFLFTSGQLPLVCREPLEVPTSIEDQTRLVLDKVLDILGKHDMDRSHIIKTTAFITDMNHWDNVNSVYAEFFGDLKPARSIIPASGLHFGCLIELEAIAYKE